MIAKKDKIYTKFLRAIPTLTFGSTVVLLAEDSWLLQEDIEVVGFQLHAEVEEQMANDGKGAVCVELSQTGVWHADGILGTLSAVAEWNTAPAFGHTDRHDISVIFPAGHRVTVKEEGYLYLHMCVDATELTAGIVKTEGFAIIYYLKA